MYQISFKYLSPAVFLTAGEAGWHLHLSALRPNCWQTHHLYSGGQEPEENGRGWTVRYRNRNELLNIAPHYHIFHIWHYFRVHSLIKIETVVRLMWILEGCSGTAALWRSVPASTTIRSVLLCSRADAAVLTMQQLTHPLASSLAPSVGALQHCNPDMHVHGMFSTFIMISALFLQIPTWKLICFRTARGWRRRRRQSRRTPSTLTTTSPLALKSHLNKSRYNLTHLQNYRRVYEISRKKNKTEVSEW